MNEKQIVMLRQYHNMGWSFENSVDAMRIFIDSFNYEEAWSRWLDMDTEAYK
jgi:hypothetical protein